LVAAARIAVEFVAGVHFHVAGVSEVKFSAGLSGRLGRRRRWFGS
jgi:hypothetical protein